MQVTKDPIGHKGARLTQQINLPGRFLVYVPGGSMTGISRKLPDTERHAAQGHPQEDRPRGRRRDHPDRRRGRLGGGAHPRRRPAARRSGRSSRRRPSRPRTRRRCSTASPTWRSASIRDVFNEDFKELVVQGDDAWDTVEAYVAHVSPELAGRLTRYTGEGDVFHDLRVDEQLAKALDRKVWLPSGGSLVIDRTEAMTVVDVNTGKFVGSGGNLEQTVTRNNLEAAEEIVRQLRLRDIGGIIVIDFIDMVLESNRDLVLRRLTECLGRDRTKHQVAEVTSLGLVQMTRKRVGQGLLEVVLRAVRALPRPRRDRAHRPGRREAPQRRRHRRRRLRRRQRGRRQRGRRRRHRQPAAARGGGDARTAAGDDRAADGADAPSGRRVRRRGRRPRRRAGRARPPRRRARAAAATADGATAASPARTARPRTPPCSPAAGPTSRRPSTDGGRRPRTRRPAGGRRRAAEAVRSSEAVAGRGRAPRQDR